MNESSAPAPRSAGPKVSVVVPVFNTEPYLDECLGSLVAQTIPDIEILCVDDGSSDGSAAKLSEWAVKDPRIRILRQENRGGGAARNAGMDAARGDFLFFCDSDDACEPEMLEEMLRAADGGRADVVISPRAIWDNRLSEKVSVTNLPESLTNGSGPFSGKSLASDVFTVSGNTAWNKLFSRPFVVSNRIRNAELPDSGDLPFVNLSMALAERIAASRRALYKYRFGRPGGAVVSAEKSPLNLFRCFDFLRDELVARGRFDEFAAAFAKALFVSVGYQMSGFRSANAVSLSYARLREELLGLRPRCDLLADGILDGVLADGYRVLLDSPDPLPFLLSCWRGSLQRANALRIKNAELEGKWRTEGALRQATRSRWEADVASLRAKWAENVANLRAKWAENVANLRAKREEDVANVRSQWKAEASRLHANWEKESRKLKEYQKSVRSEQEGWLRTRKRLEDRIAALEAESGRNEEKLREAKRLLAETVAAAKRQRRRFERSLSWRITAPLRAVVFFFLRIFGKRERKQ